MPNDLSNTPAPDASPTLLALRTERYVARAKAVADDPSLTMGQAADALDHLANLQADLKAARQRELQALTQDLAVAEAQFAPHEALLREARAGLSCALLRADPGDRAGYGIVPHGEDATSGGPIQAVSACRALLDLEALRPYLGEDALRRAIDAHAKATGRHDISGVTYAALPASAHLPCEMM